jgi:prepilin peptidase CpaA
MMYVPDTASDYVVAAMMVLAIAGAISDVRTYRIPNSINLIIAGLFPVYVLFNDAGVDWGIAAMIAGGAFAVSALLFTFGAIGGGDAKMLTALALWAGPAHLADFVFTTTIVGGLAAILMMTSARHALALAAENLGQHRLSNVFQGDVLPYGVAIAAGAVVVGLQLIAA